MKKTMVGVMLCAVLAVSMFPCAALAAPVTAGSSPLTTEASSLSKKCMNLIEGWWAGTYVNSDYRVCQSYAFIHGGKVYWFNSPVGFEDYAPVSSFKYVSQVNITGAQRFKYKNATGWKINTVTDSWAYYLLDGSDVMEMYSTYPSGYFSASGLARALDKNLDSLLKKSPLSGKSRTKNPISAKAVKTVSLTAKNLSNQGRYAALIEVSKAAGKVTFKNISSSSKVKSWFSVDSKGHVVAKKGTPKGTYKLKVKVNCKESKLYKASSTTVSFKIKVK